MLSGHGVTPCYHQHRVLCSPDALHLTSYILVGCKHRASEGVFYIGGRGFVCQIIEPVTFARCAFIFALRNIALGGYIFFEGNNKN